MSSLIRVGVLRGGPGHEYEVSLKTGASVLSNLPTDRYRPRDILLTKDGLWHLDGLPITLARLAANVDVIFNALHGEFGEDGGVQTILETMVIPYTGSGRLASALGMNKAMAKDLFRQEGIKVPQGLTLNKKDCSPEAEAVAYDVFTKIAPPWIIKPAASGSSVGLFLAKTFPELVTALDNCFQFSNVVLVEEYIRGREATCGVVDKLRGQEIYPLMPIEIIPPADKTLFDYDAKYSGQSQEICPGRFSLEDKEKLQDLAARIHRRLGLRHYSRSDFIISPRGIYALEVNTLPGLTTESLIPKSLKALGISYPDFLDHVVTLALERR